MLLQAISYLYSFQDQGCKQGDGYIELLHFKSHAKTWSVCGQRLEDVCAPSGASL